MLSAHIHLLGEMPLGLVEQVHRAGLKPTHTPDISHGDVSPNDLPQPLDLLVIRAPGYDAAPEIAQLVEALRADPARRALRIVLLGAADDGVMAALGHRIDDFITAHSAAPLVIGRIRALLRLATMHSELERRMHTTGRYGADAPVVPAPAGAIGKALVLVTGDASRLALAEAALARDATLVGALTSATAQDYLLRQPFDAAIYLAGPEPAPMADFARAVRRNSRLYNLPLLGLSDVTEEAEIAQLAEAGITDLLGSQSPLDIIRLRTLALVREQRFRETLRAIYAQAKHFATNDALTGLFSRGYLLEHLDTIIAHAQQSGREFSLAALALTNMPKVNGDIGFASADRAIRQVGELIALLTRGEDLAARYSGARFMVVLPDTPAEQAQHALRRILGVVQQTEFTIETVDHPIRLRAEAGVVAYQPRDTPDGIVARAWGAVGTFERASFALAS